MRRPELWGGWRTRPEPSTRKPRRIPPRPRPRIFHRSIDLIEVEHPTTYDAPYEGWRRVVVRKCDKLSGPDHRRIMETPESENKFARRRRRKAWGEEVLSAPELSQDAIWAGLLNWRALNPEGGGENDT